MASINSINNIIPSANLTISAGNLLLPTTSSTAGQITINGNRFLHSFGTSNTFLGDLSGNTTMGTSGSRNRRNVGIGSSALLALAGSTSTQGASNTAVGYQALTALNSAQNCTAIGSSSGSAITTGSSNSFLGASAGSTITVSANNVFVGAFAGSGMVTGSDSNVAIGSSAMQGNPDASVSNVAIGMQALQSLTATSFCIAIGDHALGAGVNVGQYNIAIGASSGSSYILGEANNVLIQSAGVANDANTIRIGTNGSGANQQNITYLAGGNILRQNTAAFLATLTTNDSNVTGDGTSYTVIFDNEIYDQGSNFNLGTSVFTAPITGRYHFCVGLFAQELGVAFTDLRTTLVTSNRNYSLVRINPSTINVGGLLAMGNSAYVDMDAADTATVTFLVAGSTKTVDLLGDAGATNFFSGMLQA